MTLVSFVREGDRQDRISIAEKNSIRRENKNEIFACERFKKEKLAQLSPIWCRGRLDCEAHVRVQVALAVGECGGWIQCRSSIVPRGERAVHIMHGHRRLSVPPRISRARPPDELRKQMERSCREIRLMVHQIMVQSACRFNLLAAPAQIFSSAFVLTYWFNFWLTKPRNHESDCPAWMIDWY